MIGFTLEELQRLKGYVKDRVQRPGMYKALRGQLDSEDPDTLYRLAGRLALLDTREFFDLCEYMKQLE